MRGGNLKIWRFENLKMMNYVSPFSRAKFFFLFFFLDKKETIRLDGQEQTIAPHKRHGLACPEFIEGRLFRPHPLLRKEIFI